MVKFFVPIFCFAVFCYANINDVNSNSAIQLVYTSRNSADNSNAQYHVNTDALRSLPSYNGSFDVISLIGQARRGKSYTLNKIIQQMSGTSVMPFETSDDYKPCTYGVWMYILAQCSNNNNGINMEVGADGSSKNIKHPWPCISQSNGKQYIFLDIEGSDTEGDDEALRYASIVTLLSTQSYLFLHGRLYNHNIDVIQHIETFIAQLNKEKIDLNIGDINLGVIVREPFRTDGDLINVVNADIRHPTNNDKLKFFSAFSAAFGLQDKDKDLSLYNQGIKNLVDWIMKDDKQAQRSSRAGIKNIKLTIAKMGILLEQLVNQLNTNKDISAICITCVYKHVVEWHKWDLFSQCSKPCDGGTQIRYRQCNTGSINDCVNYIGGNNEEIRECNTFKCEWSAWSDWSICTTICNGGKQYRTRKCSTGNSKDCISMFGGSEKETKACNTQKCEWQPVGDWSECTHRCGDKGTQKRYRKCETNRNSDCDGKDVEIRECNRRKCKWDYIGNWSECSKKCGGGIEKRYRVCESGDDSDCLGNNYETKSCNKHKCRWIKSGVWSRCSSVCGWGRKTRSLFCETGDDKDCEGNNYETTSCHESWGCDDGDCYSSNSWVIVGPHYEKKQIVDVKVNDKVLSYDYDYINNTVGGGELNFSPVILLGHFTAADGGERISTMISLVFGNYNYNDSITLAKNHMLYARNINNVDETDWELKPVSHVNIGDFVHFYDGFNDSVVERGLYDVYNDEDMMKNQKIIMKMTWKQVVGIEYVQTTPRTIFTLSGNVIVNGVVTSSFTGKNWIDHKVQNHIVNGIYYVVNYLSPSTVNNYDRVAWIRNTVYYGGLKWALKHLEVLIIAVIVASVSILLLAHIRQEKKFE